MPLSLTPKNGTKSPVIHISSISKKGDCANFVSQAMQAGGWEYAYGDRNSDKYWYYGTPYTTKASLTFINAHSLWRFSKRRGAVLKYAYDARLADIVWFDDIGDGTLNHSMIVTGYLSDAKMPLLTYHSNDQINVTLNYVIQANKKIYGDKTTYYAVRT